MTTSSALCGGLLFAVSCAAASAQSFAAASIRPSAGQVQFEHDGITEVSPGNLRMRDVTAATCIKFAYSVLDSQISGPEWLQTEHFDIIAKADGPVAPDQLKLMMQSLLGDRFGLRFHRQEKELRSYLMTVAKGGHKLHESSADTQSFRENSAVGTIARAMTMKDLADFLSGPLQTPIVDNTGLTGKYDFVLDFTAYLPDGERVMKKEFSNATGIIISAMQGELGLRLESKKESVEVLMVDHAELPSAN